MVVGWLMEAKKMPMTAAMKKVKECRPSVRIQPHWIKQLQLLEEQTDDLP